MRKFIRSMMVLLFFALFFLPSAVSAYCLNAYNGMTGAKVFSILPSFYSSYDPEFGLSFDPIVSYGFCDKFDLYVNPSSITFIPDVAYDGSWIMPRYDLGNNNILALQMKADYNQTNFAYSLAPQFHFFLEKDKVAFEMNALFTIPLDAPDMAEARIVFAPVWKTIPNKLNLFLECDAYSLINDIGIVTVDLIPGACVTIGEGQLCVGLVLSDLKSGLSSPGLNCWYFQDFGGK